MRLTDPWFEAAFVGRVSPDGRSYYSAGFMKEGPAMPFADAQGLILWCPCGYGNRAYPIDGARPHGLLVPFRDRGVPDGFGPLSRDGKTRPRWRIVGGDSLETLTLEPSIDAGCWHGHITNGEIK